MQDNSDHTIHNQQSNYGVQGTIHGDVHYHGDQRQQRQIDRTERKYRTAIADDLDQLELFGLPRMKDVVRHQKLSNAYITLSVMRRDAPDDVGDDPHELRRQRMALLDERRPRSGPVDKVLPA
jgi:hypothetical protein